MSIAGPASRNRNRIRLGTGRRRVGAAVATSSLLLTLLLAGHRYLPELDGVGVGLNSILPWLGLLLLLLVPAAVANRSRTVVGSALLPTLVWTVMFAPALLRQPPDRPAADFTVVQQNIGSDNPHADATAQTLLHTGADLIAVEKLSTQTSEPVARVLDHAYSHHARIGTVGLWSRYPISNAKPVDLDLGWTRAFRVTAQTPVGATDVFVAHLDSIRPGDVTGRARSLAALTRAVTADRAPRILVVGDLNTATTDPALTELLDQLRDSQQSAGTGFGFTWPASFPITRPDHILYRGISATFAATKPTAGSPHRAVVTGFADGGS